MTMLTCDESGAFVTQFEIVPSGEGPLSGLRFAVKDLIDLQGHVTGGGNPSWRDRQLPALHHAVCVEQLLDAGASCVGKTVTDELAFSLLGENHFYGTPLNPRAPERIPGGSSSGSASAVAGGACDFALGTDTGGSVRVPASNCGIYGFRPSHGAMSLGGVLPFAPGFDTVGVLASRLDVLIAASEVLLACSTRNASEPDAVFLLVDAFEVCDEATREALGAGCDRVRNVFGDRVREIRIADLADEPEGLAAFVHAYRHVQWAEIWNTFGSWVELERPELGPRTEYGFNLCRTMSRAELPGALRRRETWFQRLRARLGARSLLVLPTTPEPAPLHGTAQAEYYARALSLTSIASLNRLPQISLPAGEVAGAPVGLSLTGPHFEDAFLLAAARQLGEWC